jgi:hypothetical protein
MLKVVREAKVVTVLPLASSAVTTGWVNAVPSVTEPPGCVVKTSWLAVPATIVMFVDVAEKDPLVADSV